MSATTHRIAVEQGVEVTDEQVAAVTADLAAALQRTIDSPGGLLATSQTPCPRAFGEGLRTALTMIQSVVAEHRRNHGGDT